MKKSVFVLAAALAVCGVCACKPSQKGAAVDAAHNSQNSVNWEGVYAGTIPAADAEGIDVRITLSAGETYEIRYAYRGKPGEFAEKGSFAWDETGGVIKLDTDSLPPYYRVGEGVLIQLDMQGNEIAGSLADLYVLRKEL